MTDPSSEASSIFRFDIEIKMLRIAIRKSGMLSHPYDDHVLRSLDGNTELVNFYVTAVENYQKYKADFDHELAPVFVTGEEEAAFNDVVNWTIDKIKKKTSVLIEQLSCQDTWQMFTTLRCNMNRAKKSDYISFYIDVKTESIKQSAMKDVQNIENDHDYI